MPQCGNTNNCEASICRPLLSKPLHSTIVCCLKVHLTICDKFRP